ncbi:hypothetical protein HDU97_007132 [Phlyctochytrium planicorne]|nr:hypothetical protein HDU97_007132 [Phlyctochytrium planicorne]
MSLGSFSRAPPEIVTTILRLSGDWKLSLTIEAIRANLPNLYEDAGKAVDSVKIRKVFMASCDIVQSKAIQRFETGLSLLKVAFALKFNPGWEHSMLTAHLSNVKIVKYLHQGPTSYSLFQNYTHFSVQGPQSWSNAMEMATRNGHMDVVKYLYENPECPLLDGAVCSENFELLKYLHGRPRSRATKAAMDRAAEMGRLDMVQFLHFNRTEGCTKAAMDKALANRHFDIARFLSQHRKEGFTPKPYKMDYAAKEGQLEHVKLLHEIGQSCTTAAMDEAAGRGFLDIVKYLHENSRVGCTNIAMDHAAANGHLEVVKFLHFNRTEGCTQNAMDEAARNCHLDVVVFLHTHRTEGCTKKAMDGYLTDQRDDNKAHLSASMEKRREEEEKWLQVLKFLHFNRSEGCTKDLMDSAARRGCLQILKFLHESRSEGCTEKAMDDAAKNGHLDIVEFLHAHRTEGCTTVAMDEAACNGHLAIVRFLHENRSEGCTKNAMDSAAAKGHLEVVKFLKANRKEGATRKALSNAAKGGHFDVVRFLYGSRKGKKAQICWEDFDRGLEELGPGRRMMAGKIDIFQFIKKFEGRAAAAKDEK